MTETTSVGLKDKSILIKSAQVNESIEEFKERLTSSRQSQRSEKRRSASEVMREKEMIVTSPTKDKNYNSTVF